MARRIDPLIYKPMLRNYSRAKNRGEKHFMKYLRNCGSNYASRAEVRETVFSRDGRKCVDCGDEESLQIDHIISVYQVFKNGVDIREVNSLSNLQTLCSSCNAGKNP